MGNLLLQHRFEPVCLYNMDDNEKDEMPMLPESCRQLLDKREHSQYHRRTSWARSSSLSLCMNSHPSYLENNIAGQTGPLRSERRSSFIQMSGPLYIRSTPQDLYNPTNNALGYNTRGGLELSTYNRMTDSEWPNDNYGGSNEQLLKSGQLRMYLKKIRFHGHRLHSTRTVRCLTNVEAFILRAEDLEDVTYHFARFLRNPRVQRAIRYESPYWRCFAATQIQVAWRYRKKRLRRADSNVQSSVTRD